MTDTSDMQARSELVEGAEPIRAALRSLLAGASREVLLSVPAEELQAVRAPLERAVDDGVSVLLLLYGDGDPPADIGDVATVARQMGGYVPLTCTVDESVALIAWPWALSAAADDQTASILHNRHVAVAMFGEFIGNYWSTGNEVYVSQPPSLPRTYTTFRGSVLDATLHLRRGSPLRVVCDAIATGGGSDTLRQLTGRALDVRQGFVYPMTNRFPAENGLVLRVAGERTTVGGIGAYRERYEASRVRLESV